MLRRPLHPATLLLPFPDVPYPAAPAWSFSVAEWSFLFLLLLCGVHAVRKGRKGALSYLLGGFAFGLLLEYVEVLSHSYTYGHFQLSLGHAPLNVPICIGAGWGIILYTSRLFSDALELPLAAAAALDTLLALNIDLSMDVVAYRLHMWHWDWTGTGLNPLRAEWFGVPFGNFVGWATVVFCYSAFSRFWEGKLAPRSKTVDPAASEGNPSTQTFLSKHAYRFSIVAVLSLISSQAVLLVLETWGWIFLREHFGITSGVRLLLIVAAMAALVGYGWRGHAGTLQRAPAIAFYAPCWFHLYFVFCFLWLRLYRENEWMDIAAALNLTVGILIHTSHWNTAWLVKQSRSR